MITKLLGVPGFLGDLIPGVSDTVKYIVLVAALLIIVSILAIILLVFANLNINRIGRKYYVPAIPGYDRMLACIVGAEQRVASFQSKVHDVIGDDFVYLTDGDVVVAEGGYAVSYKYGGRHDYNAAPSNMIPEPHLSDTLVGLRRLIYAAKTTERDLKRLDGIIADGQSNLATQRQIILILNTKMARSEDAAEKEAYKAQIDELADNAAVVTKTVTEAESRRAVLKTRLTGEVRETTEYISAHHISEEEVRMVEELVVRELAGQYIYQEHKDDIAAPSEPGKTDKERYAKHRFEYLSSVAAVIISGSESREDTDLKLELLRTEAERAELHARVTQSSAKAAVYDAQNCAEEDKERLKEFAVASLVRANESRLIAQIVYGYYSKARTAVADRSN